MAIQDSDVSQACLELVADRETSRLHRALAALRIDHVGWSCLLLLAATLTGWALVATGSVVLSGVLFFLFLPVCLFYLGRAILTVARARDEVASFPLVFITGTVTFAILLLCVQLPRVLSIYTNCLILLLGSVVLQVVVGMRSPLRAAERRGTWADLFVVLLSLAAATGWSQDVVGAVSQTGDAIVFKPWEDYFTHASLSARFQADQGLWRLGRYELLGKPAPFYHYCSYVLPASVSAFAGQTGYQAVTGFWTPFGVFLSGLAVYALIRSWWGPLAGVCALAGLLLMPDSSSYGFRSPFMGYHWIQQVAPAGSYGVAAGALALWWMMRGTRQRYPLALALGFGYALASVAIKAQVFVVVLPTVCLWIVIAPRFAPRYKVLLALAFLAIGVVGIRVADSHHLGPPLTPDGTGLVPYLRFLFRDLPPTVFRGWLPELRTERVPLWVWPVRLAFIVTVTFGAYAFIAPALLLWLKRRKQLQAVDGLPVLTVAIYLYCVFALPRNDLTPSGEELQHRPFIWAYFVVVAWTWGRLCTLAAGSRLARSCLRPAVAAPLCLALLAVPFSFGAGIAERFTLCNLYTRIEVPRGLADCASFIREHGDREDGVQYSAVDEHTVVLGLTERRAYLCCSPRTSPIPERYSAEVRKRVATITRLKRALTVAAVQERAAAMGVRWYLMAPDDEVRWPADYLARPAFSSGGYRVYDLRRAAAPDRDDRG
jgi:hypothetical protein